MMYKIKKRVAEMKKHSISYYFILISSVFSTTIKDVTEKKIQLPRLSLELEVGTQLYFEFSKLRKMTQTQLYFYLWNSQDYQIIWTGLHICVLPFVCTQRGKKKRECKLPMSRSNLGTPSSVKARSSTALSESCAYL